MKAAVNTFKMPRRLTRVRAFLFAVALAACAKTGATVVEEADSAGQVQQHDAAVGDVPTDDAAAADAATADETAADVLLATPCPSRPGLFTDCWPTSGFDIGSVNSDSVPKELPATTGGAVADIDADGWPDVFAFNPFAPGRLYRNQGAMQFVDVTLASGIVVPANAISDAAFGDLDNDGDSDLVVLLGMANALKWYNGGPRNGPITNSFSIWRNDGQGHFTDVTAVWGFHEEPMAIAAFGAGLSLVDINFDQRLDIVETRQMDKTATVRVYLSQPDGTWQFAGDQFFPDSTGVTWAGYWSDFNDDGLLDFAQLNDKNPGYPSHLYVRKSPLDLTFVATDVMGYFGQTQENVPMGASAADLNGDGQLEYLISNDGDQRVLTHVLAGVKDLAGSLGLILNPNHAGTPSVAFGAAFVGVDNDGQVDVFLTGSTLPDKPALPYSSLALRSGPTFQDAFALFGDPMSYSERGLALADFDRDGRVDLLTGGYGEIPRLLHNEIAGGHSLAVQLLGHKCNRAGIGARVTVQIPGLAPQTMEMFPGGQSYGYSEARLIFGAGAATTASQVTVSWWACGGQQVQVLTNVAFESGKTVVIEEP